MKNGMQMLLESLLPPDTLNQIQQAATAIPEIAHKVQLQLDRLEMTLANVESIVERIENKVLADDPPERTPLSDFVMAAIAESTIDQPVRYLNGEARTVLPSEVTGEFPETLRKELEKDGRTD